MKKVGSYKYANYIMIFLLAILVIGQTYSKFMESSISGESVFSTLLLVITLFLGLSTGICTWKRVRTEFKNQGNYKYCGEIKILQNERLRLNKNFKNNVMKRGIPYTSIVFHLSMLGVLFALLLSMLFSFYGRIMLTEGQIKNHAKPAYMGYKKGLFAKWPESGYQLALAGTKEEFQQGKAEPVNLLAQLMIMENHNILAQSDVKPNKSFNFKDINIAYDDYGFAPQVLVYNQSGSNVLDSYVNLAWATNDDIIYIGKDCVEVPNTKLYIDIELYPHAKLKEDGSLITLSNQLVSPAFYIRVMEGEQVVFDGKAILGQRIRCSNGIVIVIPEIRKWVIFLIKRDVGYKIMILFAVILAIALMLAVIFPRYKLIINGNSILWYTDKYPNLLIDRLHDLVGSDITSDDI